jgi:hypothetical protein
MLWKRLKDLNYAVLRHNKIDLIAESGSSRIFFEVKTCDDRIVGSQVRRGVSQLLEYRYLSSRRLSIEPNAVCLVLESEPTATNAWLIDYVNSIGIDLIWIAPTPVGFGGRSSNPLIQSLLGSVGAPAS